MCLVVVIAGLGVWGPGAWSEGETEAPESDPPSLSIEGADSQKMVLSRATEPEPSEPKTWWYWDDELTGETRVVLSNSGPEDATPTFALVITAPDTDCADSSPSNPPAVTVPRSGSTTYDLRFTLDDACVGLPAVLVVTGTGSTTQKQSEPQSAQIELARNIDGWDFGPPLALAVVAGVAFFVIAAGKYGQKWDQRTPGGDAWSFSDSWLTSISAVGTALGGVLAASGFVDELLPGVPLGNFLGLSLTFGGLVIAAPMVFALRQTVDWKVEGEGAAKVKAQVVAGRVGGLILAGTCTCAGVAGLLAMLAVLALLSNAPGGAQIVVLACLALLAIVATIYVTVSTKNAVTMSTEPKPNEPLDGTRGVLARPSQITGFSGAF